jgi:cobalt-zinc-cadmium efflux system outer membrane protein
MRNLSAVLLIAVGTIACATRPSNLPPLVETQIHDRTGQTVRSPDQRPDGSLPPGIDLRDGVTEDEAAAVALWNNAQLAADLAAAGVARGNLYDAGQFRNPTLQALFPVGPKPFELTVFFAVEQLWQRPKRVAAALKQWEQVAQSLVQNGLDTTRDARQAQAALLQAQDRARAARDLAGVRSRIAEMAQARLRSGDISVLEARMAQTDAAVGVDQARRSDHGLVLARDRLRIVLGVATPTTLEAAPTAINRTAPPPVDELREQAWTTRPDLRALELGVAAAAARAKWERSRWIALGAVLSSKEVGTSGVRTGPGISVDIPIFRTNAGAVSRADAEVEQAARQYIAHRQRIDLEVSEARTLLAQALDSLEEWQDRVTPALKSASEKTRLAYEAGDISYLAVVEVSRQWMDAVLRDIDLQAAARQARAELDRSVGTRLSGGTRP